jgi:hypothetical protein
MPEEQSDVKITQVDEQCAFLDKSLVRLAETINFLEARLERVIRPLEPEETKEGDEANFVPMADFIRSKAWQVQVCSNRINSLLQRLEL